MKLLLFSLSAGYLYAEKTGVNEQRKTSSNKGDISPYDNDTTAAGEDLKNFWAADNQKPTPSPTKSPYDNDTTAAGEDLKNFWTADNKIPTPSPTHKSRPLPVGSPTWSPTSNLPPNAAMDMHVISSFTKENTPAGSPTWSPTSNLPPNAVMNVEHTQDAEEAATGHGHEKFYHKTTQRFHDSNVNHNAHGTYTDRIVNLLERLPQNRSQPANMEIDYCVDAPTVNIIEALHKAGLGCNGPSSGFGNEDPEGTGCWQIARDDHYKCPQTTADSMNHVVFYGATPWYKTLFRNAHSL